MILQKNGQNKLYSLVEKRKEVRRKREIKKIGKREEGMIKERKWEVKQTKKESKRKTEREKGREKKENRKNERRTETERGNKK